MAEGGGGGVGFVEGKGFAEAEDLLGHAGNLGFAGAAESDDGLFDTQRRIFKNRLADDVGGGDCRSAGGAEYLSDLEVVDVNGFFERDVANRIFVAAVRAELVDFAETVCQREGGLETKRAGEAQFRFPV